MRVIGRLIRQAIPAHVPSAAVVVGMGFIVAATLLAFGLAPALAATGLALLIVGWAAE